MVAAFYIIQTLIDHVIDHDILTIMLMTKFERASSCSDSKTYIHKLNAYLP